MHTAAISSPSSKKCAQRSAVIYDRSSGTDFISLLVVEITSWLRDIFLVSVTVFYFNILVVCCFRVLHT